jgi:hypothetical protein
VLGSNILWAIDETLLYEITAKDQFPYAVRMSRDYHLNFKRDMRPKTAMVRTSEAVLKIGPML